MTMLSAKHLPARSLLAAALTGLALAACSTGPSWHWEKRGASEAQYDQDLKFCKFQTYAGATDGMVTGQSVRLMHACMESRGWRKVSDQ